MAICIFWYILPSSRAMFQIKKKKRIEQFESVCREHGFPVTIHRRMVLEAMLDQKDHPTADRIYELIKKQIPGISRTTVYRILDTFVQLGIIVKVCHHGAAARFDPVTQWHHHLVCMHCDRIIDIEDARLNKVQWPDVRHHRFRISDYHIHFRGICDDCRKKLEKGGSISRKANKPNVKKRASRKKKRSSRKRRTKP